MPNLIDLTGQKYGMLTVLKRVPNKGKKVRWLCQCECGRKVIALSNSLRMGRTKTCGHHRSGVRNPAWKGGTIIVSGYRIIRDNNKSKREHRYIAEQVLARPLKNNEVVHHINMNKLDNRKSNLLICDHSYHNIIHHRMALKYCQLAGLA